MHCSTTSTPMVTPASRPPMCAAGWYGILLAAVLTLVLRAAPAAADNAAPALPGDRAVPGQMLEEPPRYGMYYDRREPSFYTGFAPRTLDPRRIHIHLGRGNQLRVTVVLADDVLEEYARDLRERRRTYRALVDDGHVVLTQNDAFDVFEARLDALELERLVGEERALAPEALRARNLALLEQLEPGRVHRIRIPLPALVRKFAASLRPEDRTRMDARRQLEVVNLLLPTRLWIPALEPGVGAAVTELVRALPVDPDGAAIAAVTPRYVALLARVSGGIYPERDGALVFEEFTAIYPVGSVALYTQYEGRTIPLYPTPGRRALTTHQRTLTVDHIPIDESYSYSPWLPYMHVTPTMHNSIHTLWWQMPVATAPFLPAAWRNVDRGRRAGTGGAYKNLWLLSRGPMSHGCTHLNVGHIAELRQMLPSETERMYEVDTFLAKSHQYDVFDVDGDLAPEVIGVKYFIAYSLRDKRAERLRVRNERRAFYDWLYGGELEWHGDQGRFPIVHDARFVDRSAVEGATYVDLPLWEAPYLEERVQFYALLDIPFARELRKVGARHAFVPPDRLQQAKAGADRWQRGRRRGGATQVTTSR